MKKIIYLLMVTLLTPLFLLGAVSPVAAMLIGGPDIIAAPQYAIDDNPGAENLNMQAFDEAQSVFLSSAIMTDLGNLATGITVDSHMIFLNTPGGRYAEDRQTWSFDGEILGVMSDRYGTLEALTSGLLGAPGTVYPGSFAARGMEGGDSYTVSGSMIDVYMAVTEPGDWIRVVTQSTSSVPEPANMLLLGTGLIGLVFGSRKKLIK